MPATTASAELWITAISEGLGEDVGGGDRQDASRDVGDPLARCDREAQIIEPASTDHRGGAAAEVLQGSLAIDGPGPLHLAHQGRSMLTALQDHTGPMWSSRLSSSTGRIVAPSHARFRPGSGRQPPARTPGSCRPRGTSGAANAPETRRPAGPAPHRTLERLQELRLVERVLPVGVLDLVVLGAAGRNRPEDRAGQIARL